MLEDLKEALETKGEITIAVKVHASAKQTRVKSVLADGVVKIDLQVAPEKGKANEALVNFLAEEFAVSTNNITVTLGKFSKDKLVVVKK
ncbi:MAG: DUF167 domain-containing protein [Patescibacteria group bacterium]|nr:MAG: DUF167 domain-containing protein [Patescibacteria group bacterium]